MARLPGAPGGYRSTLSAWQFTKHSKTVKHAAYVAREVAQIERILDAPAVVSSRIKRPPKVIRVVPLPAPNPFLADRSPSDRNLQPNAVLDVLRARYERDLAKARALLANGLKRSELLGMPGMVEAIEATSFADWLDTARQAQCNQ